jgi:serine/threonine-protein kinase
MTNPEEVTESTSATPERELSGTQLGDYQILRRLGRGGMADVYLAEQRSLHRRVALKVLRRALAEDESYLQRFRNEARAAASLIHANIVQIYEVGRVGDVQFIAQEYVDGANLKQVLSRHGALSVEQAVLVMRQVASALQKAGSQGIVHRDIKPENILINASGEAKVADFGLARISSDASKLGLTQIGVTLGTPLYMSPEQVQGGAIDARSDLYSLGVSCYHMLAGRPPFEGDTALNVAVQHLNNEAESLQRVRPDLPDDLCAIVHKMLQKNPADRYQTAADLLRDLRQLRVNGELVEWPENLRDLETSEQLALVEARTAATQQLQTVMVTAERQRRAQTWARRRWLVAAALAFMGGVVLAIQARPPDVLELTGDEKFPGIEKQATVDSQYTYAFTMSDSEEAWKAVWEYFPPDDAVGREKGNRTVHMRLAKRQLADLYMKSGDLNGAMRIFEELVVLDATEAFLRAWGLVGQATVLAREGKMKEAWEKLAEAQKIELTEREVELLQPRLERANQLIRTPSEETP